MVDAGCLACSFHMVYLTKYFFDSFGSFQLFKDTAFAFGLWIRVQRVVLDASCLVGYPGFLMLFDNGTEVMLGRL